MNIPRIIPPSKQPCIDVARAAKATNCRLRIMHNRVVMLPRKAANQEMPRAA